MNPLVAPALISAGGSLLGGLFGSKQSDLPSQRAQAQFDQQMDHSVRRRVEDAKRAGLHPLFALGASPGASPTAHISGQSDSGSLIGEGIGQAARSVAKAFDPATQAQLKNIESSTEANFAQAQLYRSQAKRAEVEANSGPVRTFAATESPPFKGTPISIDTPMGVFTPERPDMAEKLEQHYGGGMDALGFIQFLKEWWSRPTARRKVEAGRKQRERTRAFIKRFLTPMRGN